MQDKDPFGVIAELERQLDLHARFTLVALILAGVAAFGAGFVFGVIASG